MGGVFEIVACSALRFVLIFVNDFCIYCNSHPLFILLTYLFYFTMFNVFAVRLGKMIENTKKDEACANHKHNEGRRTQKGI